MLETLWRSALPDKPFERLSRHWADTFGFQGRDPATDVRGGGFVALQHLWRFAATSPTHPGALVRSGFPLAIASITATAMLQSYLGLNPDVVPALAAPRRRPRCACSRARRGEGGRARSGAARLLLTTSTARGAPRAATAPAHRDTTAAAAAAAAHLQRASSSRRRRGPRASARARAPSQPLRHRRIADLRCASPIAMTMAFLLLLAQSLSGRRG